MPEFASPMLRRWELGNALRRLREERGMTIAEVTAAMKQRYGSSFSTTKLSRMETARRGVIPRDVHDLCVLYGVTDERRDHLVDLAKSSRESDRLHADEESRGYRWYSALEQIAGGVREYTSMFMPGLLQTADYASVVENLQTVAPEYYSPRLEPEDIPEKADDRVAIRLERQRLLDRPDPLRLHIVMDQSALSRRLTRPEVMRDQLDHLLEAMKRPNIRIQVMPFEAGLYPGSECAYWSILDFPDGDQYPARTIYSETVEGAHITDREADVARLVSAFELQTELALNPDQSRDLIERIRARIPQ